MSFHRATLVALTTLLTVGLASAAFAGCCEWGTPAPVVYAATGCGGCGAVVAPAYAVPPAPIAYGGCGGCGAPVAYVPPPAPVAWGTGCGGCGCGGCGGVVYATPAIEPMPVAPAPIYVVNQGPEYAGPGIVVPYRVYTPSAAYAPETYPYVPGYYGPRPYPRHVAYGPRWHGYPHGYPYHGYPYHGYRYRPVHTLD